MNRIVANHLDPLLWSRLLYAQSRLAYPDDAESRRSRRQDVATSDVDRLIAKACVDYSFQSCSRSIGVCERRSFHMLENQWGSHSGGGFDRAMHPPVRNTDLATLHTCKPR